MKTFVLFHADTCSTLKKRAKYKAHVEASICEAYIVEEISIFMYYNFEPHLRTRINCVPRHDDSSEMSPILDDPHQKMLSREDICVKKNLY
jgi:hypothetical protein